MPQATSRRRPSAPFSLLAPGDRAGLPPDAVDAFPLSTLQSGVVFEAVSAGRPGLYHDVLTYRLSGRLDVAAFTGAVEELARRHPILRTSLHLDGFSDPIQVVHEHVPVPLRVSDLRGLPAEEIARRLAEDARTEVAEGFRYGTPDLVRVRIHLLADDEYQYTLSYHDAAIDSASVRILHHDLFEAYFRLVAGDGAGPDGTDGTDGRHGTGGDGGGYREFVAAEREALASADQAEFWQTTVHGAEGTRIPSYGDAVPGDGQLAIHDVELPAALAEAVSATAGRLAVPVPTVLAAVHVTVLSILSGRSDVLTGYEYSGRPAGPGADRLAGLFLNTLPLRVDCRAATWRELVATVRRTELSWQPHRRFPMPEIKRRLGVRGPLVETVFNVTGLRGLGDLSRRYGFELPRADLNARTEFPFRAEFGHDASTGELRFAIHHHTDRFSPVQIGRVAGYYLTALRALCADPDARPDRTWLPGPAETTQILGDFGGPEQPAPTETFVDVLRRVAAANPDRVALVHHGERLDYAALHAAARELAGRLRGQGLRPGGACAVALPRGVPWAVTVLAVLLGGGVYVPIDPTHPPARIAAAAARADAGLLVTDPGSVAAISSGLAGRDGAERCVVVGYGSGHDGPTDTTDTTDTALTTAPLPGDDAYILFTSGSTGEPKGARITHAGMLNHLLAKVDALDLGRRERIAQTASQSFDISVWQLLAAWTVGGSTVIYDTGTVTDAPSFLDRLAADGITVVELVPSYLDALLAENAHRPRALPALRYGLVTGEPVPVPLVRRWFEQVGVPLVNAYGPTEAADDVTHLVLHGPVRGQRVPVGRPIANTGIHVVGPDRRHRPVGCYGEIVVTGIGVGRGYVNDPERTAAAFQPNTLDLRSPLMYRTGDVGRWLPDGTLDCAGRLDSQVKVRGFRIELAEIEGAVAVMSRVDSAVAVVTPTGRLAVGHTGTATLELGEVRQALARVLPDYMLPDAVVAVDTLPLGPNGKVDRAALAATLTDRTERAGRDRRDAVPVELPASPTERFVADLFARILGVPADGLGLDDDFFEIGGHSLAAMKLAARSDGRLTLRDVVTRPTVRSLAALLDSGQAPDRPLLIGLAPAPAGAPALVCVPYAGGGAVNFLPLARKLADRSPGLAVYGVEPPGRTLTDPLQVTSGLDGAIEAVADQVAAAGHRWVAVFGHCSGSVLGLLLARMLDQRGVTVRRVFTAAKVLHTLDPDTYANEEFGRFSDQQVADWVRNKIGMAELDEMSATEIADMAQAFRVDSVESNRILCEALVAPDSIRVSCPVTQVVALDDEITAGHAVASRHWELFAPDVTATALPDGGHYFNRTRPERLAALVAAELGL